MNIEEIIHQMYKDHNELMSLAKAEFEPLRKFINTTKITSVRGKGLFGFIFQEKKVETVPLQIEYSYQLGQEDSFVKVRVIIRESSVCMYENCVRFEVFTLKDFTYNEKNLKMFVENILRLVNERELTEYGKAIFDSAKSQLKEIPREVES
jgi:hypothetical protein